MSPRSRLLEQPELAGQTLRGAYRPRISPEPCVSRWAIQTGMSDSTITKTATTLTTGCPIGRKRFAKIQIGSVCCVAAGEDRHDDLVERQREREQAAGQERAAHRGK